MAATGKVATLRTSLFQISVRTSAEAVVSKPAAIRVLATLPAKSQVTFSHVWSDEGWTTPRVGDRRRRNDCPAVVSHSHYEVLSGNTLRPEYLHSPIRSEVWRPLSPCQHGLEGRSDCCGVVSFHKYED